MQVVRSSNFNSSTSSSVLSDKQGNSFDKGTELNRLFDQIILVLSGRVAFCNGDISNQEKGENIDGQFLVFTSEGADAQTTIAHSLGRVPSGYIVVSQNKAASLYTDTTWTTSNIYLKSSTATTNFTIFIF